MKTKPSILTILFLLIFSLFSSVYVNAQDTSVLLVELTGTIDQSSLEIIKESIRQADSINAEALIVILDTPGGAQQQTFDIADIFLESSIPIVGYVFPSGSTAWSAGTYLLISTHIAAMANHTIMGSCQPVEITLEGTKVINDSKIINALVEWLTERANIYKRNSTIVEKFVTENLNINATQAYDLRVIEYVSNSIDDLLNDIDGFQVKTSAGNLTLNTINAKKIQFTPSFGIQIQRILSNPILSSILLMIGILALVFGISSPGFGAEVFGVIAILLSLVGSGFAISTLSIIFLIIGCLLLFVEIFVTPGFGIIGIGGIICLVIGSIFLIPVYPNKEWLISMEYVETAIVILLAFVVLVAIFFGFLLYKILQIRNKKKVVGTFFGEQARTIDRITPEKPGFIIYKGEYWEAISDTVIEPNSKVIIVGKEESRLIIKKN
ncbi:MAG: nodulation protein NfeD [Candidatus Thermoplasmatota archaeon]|nr:nodulation protein NfeD [Candidatus Thermoplasmatota archaeon]